jgi:diguanylate cyclase (GGDEF)-like protein
MASFRVLHPVLKQQVSTVARLYLYHDPVIERAQTVPERTQAETVNGSRLRLTKEEWAYTVARTALVAALAVIFLLGVPGAHDSQGRLLYLAALALKTLATIIFFFMVFALRIPVARGMMLVLVPDLVTVGMFTYLAREGDWYYAVAFAMPTLYALIVREHEARLAGIGVAIAYIVGVLLSGPLTVATGVIFAMKATVIALVLYLVAGSVEQRRDREESAERFAEETERLNEQLNRRVYALQAVSDITEIVHSSLDFDRVAPQVLDIVGEAIRVETCCLFVIDKARSETLFSASRGISADDAEMMGVTSPTEVGEHLTCVPVFEHDPMMVLFCTTAESLARLTDDDRLVLGAVASELVVAVENSRLYRLTSRLAVTDELTGLSNYRHFQQRLDEELLRATRYGKHLSLLMLDADDFKAFNDAHGHVPGDRALAEVGAILRNRVREVDVVARYGGEEFAIVLPETDAAGAFVVAEKIREAVELHRFEDSRGLEVCQLTVSIGLATFPTHADDKDSVLREADDALYRAKHGGKNRVRTPRHRAEEDQALGMVSRESSDEWTGD